ncbi:UDP-glucose 4-epimerase GalE [Pseudomonas oryzihabitans]|uniref:UDP-glucose 4-epimerase GalE n=1 Tax=Pseudomonas oryzihabitans TaxID=47885 RepID=UPI003CFFD6FE
METILVVGGAGYIGSHMLAFLKDKPVDVIVIDDLSSGHLDSVVHGEFIHSDFSDQAVLEKIFSKKNIATVMHFASYIQVSESVLHPSKYYGNNVVKTIQLLDSMHRFGVKNIVFSSTAAIFGNPISLKLDELHPKDPINPYGRTKNIIEQVLKDYSAAYGITSTCLRYFNAAGAHPDGLVGEKHEPETHLIPLAIKAALGELKNIRVFGCDYPTCDGTAVRDYVHVMDIVEAHWLAHLYMKENSGAFAFNLGNGNGYTVRQIIDTVERLTNMPIEILLEDRRLGDPPSLVADSTKARGALGWKPKYSNIDVIVEHALGFIQKGRFK